MGKLSIAARRVAHAAKCLAKMGQAIGVGVGIRDAADAFDLATSEYSAVDVPGGVLHLLNFGKALDFTLRAKREGLNAFDLYLVSEAHCCETLDEAVNKLRELNGIYEGPLTPHT